MRNTIEIKIAFLAFEIIVLAIVTVRLTCDTLPINDTICR